MQARPFESGDAAQWDAFCESAWSATFLHSRRFLSYHADRFQDRSLILEEKGAVVALLPAALDPQNPATVVSHPGISYGGLVHAGALRGEGALQALQAACRHYAGQGLARLRYKALPSIYHRVPAQDDLYALFRLQALRYRCDLSSCIDLGARPAAGSRRRRGLRRAEAAGLAYGQGIDQAPALWAILEENLQRKHGARPVHSLAEIELLAGRFPDRISFHAALHEGRAVAGLVLFWTVHAVHAQYIATSAAGEASGALDGLFEHAIALAAGRGLRWFDFGISNEDGGWRLNAGLHQFKSEFGSGGVVHEFYELPLTDNGRLPPPQLPG